MFVLIEDLRFFVFAKPSRQLIVCTLNISSIRVVSISDVFIKRPSIYPFFDILDNDYISSSYTHYGLVSVHDCYSSLIAILGITEIQRLGITIS